MNENNDCIVLNIPSTTYEDVVYRLEINKKENRAICNCTGFVTHGYCKHIRSYKKRVAKVLYGEDFVEKVINSFNNCYEFIKEICELYPECIGNYDKLDYISNMILESVGKHYKTETIHRSYRLLVANGEIVEPTNVICRKEKTEMVMNDINKWSPKEFTRGFSGQAIL